MKKLYDTDLNGEMIPTVQTLFRLENLSRKFQLLFSRKSFVEFFNIGIFHIITLRGPVNPGDAVKISRNQFLTQEKRIIFALRQIMVTDTEVSGIIKTALSVKHDIAFEKNGSKSQF